MGYASKTLSQAEKGYSQLDKEALAIVFGVTKFHSYLYGCPFTIYSDHKPLMYLFGEHKGIPTMASARFLRWAVTLSAYINTAYVTSHAGSEVSGGSRGGGGGGGGLRGLTPPPPPLGPTSYE